MNLYLIHGDNALASYERLEEYIGRARSKGWEIKEIDDKNQNIIDLLKEISLFSDKRLIIIKKYSNLNEKYIKFINEFTSDSELLIFNEDIIPVTFIKKLKNVKKNEIFTLSKSLWKFIDSFFPGNTKNCLDYFHQTIMNDPVELVFSLLVGQVKDLFVVLNSNENLSYPSWRFNKLKSQADKFGKEKLNKVINELLDIDLKVKSTSTNLKDELDLFIARKLE